MTVPGLAGEGLTFHLTPAEPGTHKNARRLEWFESCIDRLGAPHLAIDVARRGGTVSLSGVNG